MTSSVRGSLDLPHHVAITGGGGGIGGALAQAFAREGCEVAISGRDAARLRNTAARCAKPVATHVCDVTRPAEMENWLFETDDGHPVDCVIACAGLGGGQALAGPAGESAETARHIFDVNVHGVVNTIAPLLPRMVARKSGRLVIISSVAGLIALPDSPAYSASKAAVIVYGEALRRLLKPHGIAVTLVCPGFVDTDMVRSLPIQPPFMWSSERAAAVILEAIGRKRAMVVFPWQMRGAVFLAGMLPRFLVDRILDRLRARTFQK